MTQIQKFQYLEQIQIYSIIVITNMLTIYSTVLIMWKVHLIKNIVWTKIYFLFSSSMCAAYRKILKLLKCMWTI